MIVDDAKIEAALDYLNDDPAPGPLARRALRKAELERDRIFARLYLKTEGTVKERECQVFLEPEHIAATDTIAELEYTVDQHTGLAKGAAMLVEVWRTEQSNIRAAEKVR